MVHFAVLSKFHYHVWSLTGTVAVAVAVPPLTGKVATFVLTAETGHWGQCHAVAVADAADEVVARAEAGEVGVELGRLEFWLVDHRAGLPASFSFSFPRAGRLQVLRCLLQPQGTLVGAENKKGKNEWHDTTEKEKKNKRNTGVHFGFAVVSTPHSGISATNLVFT